MMAVHEYPQSHGSLAGLSDTDHHTQYGLPVAGTRAARPSGPWRFGRTYYATDTGELFFDNGGGWVTIPVTKAAVDALGINADTLDGLDSTQFLRSTAKAADADKLDGYDSTAFMRGLYVPGLNAMTGEYVQHLGQNTNGGNEWRVLGTITFDPQPDGVASYTGWTAEIDVYNHVQSWGQSLPNGPFQYMARITNSNAFTTSGFRTAQIGGDWAGFDFLRIVRISEWVWQLQARHAGMYQIISVKVREVVRAGGSIVYNVTGDPPVGGDGIGVTLQSSGAIYHDTRGWIELTPLNSGWTPYQTGIGLEWTPRYRRVNGIVFVEGLVNGGPTGTVATLPAGFRPGGGTAMRWNGTGGNGVCRIDYNTNGTITINGEGVQSTGWHSLAASFPAEN